MMEKIKKVLKEFLPELIPLDYEVRLQFEMLDAYFMFSRPQPDEIPELGKPIEDHKSTEEIVAALMPMMRIKRDVVLLWMRDHDYSITIVGDGSVKWAIWRFAERSTPILPARGCCE